jgi:hypothetical protein
MRRPDAFSDWYPSGVPQMPRPCRQFVDVGRVEADGRPDVDRSELAALDQPLDRARVDVEAECGFPRG